MPDQPVAAAEGAGIGHGDLLCVRQKYPCVDHMEIAENRLCVMRIRMDQRAAFDWTRARAFLATVEAGSLSKASQALGLTQPTLSRQVAGLEAELGVVLFERVGRALVLTVTGRDLLDHFRDMGAAAERIALAAAGHSQVLVGRVRISASDAFAVYVLAPLLPELREIAPGIEIGVGS